MPKRDGDEGVHKLGTVAKRAGNRGLGRPKGVPNKTTTAAKEAFRLAFEGIGGYKALAEWATENRTEFYKLYARLIPVDVTSDGKALAGVVVLPKPSA